jgi:branched-chain amino acid transport system substrate-binding protein
MRRHRARFLALSAFAAASAVAVAACGGAAGTSGGSSNTITVGVSIPLTGVFSADGAACEKGFELWASDVNNSGGLLGHPVKIKILNDNSLPATTEKDYAQLINTDHVNFVLGPFSSLLTTAAGPVVARAGYSFVAGSGGAPSVFDLKEHNLFAVSVPVVNQMVPFARWIASLPASQRPKTAAYPMVADPFADPPVKTAQGIMSAAGVKTVYSNAASPITATNLVPYAQAVAAKNAEAVVLGSVDVPTVLAFIHVFEAQHYTPHVFMAAAGPDQGLAFLNVVGPANANGIMVPNGWYGGFQDAESHVMVQNYIAKFGGTASGINADVAESYSAGQVLADAINATGSLDNAKIIAYLHSGVTVQSVQGPAKFGTFGENIAATAFIFQWQNGRFLQVLPSDSAGSSAIEPTKQTWLTG